LARAKSHAALEGVRLQKLFMEALEQKLAPPRVKKRCLEIPPIGDPDGPKLADLTVEQIEEAMFGPLDDYLPHRR